MRKHFRKFFYALLAVFFTLNMVAFLHAYRFTHFSPASTERTNPDQLSLGKKLKILFTGIENPRPTNKGVPAQSYTTLHVNSTVTLVCWQVNVPNDKGLIVLFHGYAGEKSSLLGRAEKFRALGYSTILVDFMGSGGSDGNSTSVGFHEAEQVKDCCQAIQKIYNGKIFLFGTSMGAAAILKRLTTINFNRVELSWNARSVLYIKLLVPALPCWVYLVSLWQHYSHFGEAYNTATGPSGTILRRMQHRLPVRRFYFLVSVTTV